jgi:hypothetical protein
MAIIVLTGSGNPTRQCLTVKFGVLMPKEPKIMKMDWKSLGYEREYKDGRLRWVPLEVYKSGENEDSSTKMD